MESNVDYDSLLEVVNIVVGSEGKMSDDLSFLESAMSKVFDSDVFSGPISDSCNQGWFNLQQNLSTSISSLNKISGLTSIVSEYKSADSTTSSDIAGV